MARGFSSVRVMCGVVVCVVVVMGQVGSGGGVTTNPIIQCGAGGYSFRYPGAIGVNPGVVFGFLVVDIAVVVVVVTMAIVVYLLPRSLLVPVIASRVLQSTPIIPTPSWSRRDAG